LKKNLTIALIPLLAIVGILVLLAYGVFSVYGARKARIWMLTRDMTGGTSLVYEIDTRGLTEEQKKGLSARMIAVLQKRIDPRGILPLVWRPVGDSRFEVQIPPPRPKVREKRLNYDLALSKLLAENINRTTIMRSLEKPAEERAENFRDFARGNPDRLAIIESLAAACDERNDLKNQQAELYDRLEASEDKMLSAGLNPDQIKVSRNDWVRLNEQKRRESLREFAGSEDNLNLLTGYVETYAQWIDVVEELIDPITGKNTRYKEALRAIDQLNLTLDRIDSCLELPSESPKRRQAIEELKAEFPGRAEKIDMLIAAFDEYRPFRGRLDDARDLQRMLKGAGILEFRILPKQDDAEADELRATYVTRLDEKGPEYASDNRYKWFEIENAEEWNAPNTITAPFGGKHYVLASNQNDETMLQGPGRKSWKLEKAHPTTDNMGRRAIGFMLDERGGSLFSNVTGRNIDRPLCILLDDIAISAPRVDSRIGRQGIITGSFTQTEVEDMVNKLNAGSLPAPLIEEPISVRTIGGPADDDELDKDSESEGNLSENRL